MYRLTDKPQDQIAEERVIKNFLQANGYPLKLINQASNEAKVRYNDPKVQNNKKTNKWISIDYYQYNKITDRMIKILNNDKFNIATRPVYTIANVFYNRGQGRKDDFKKGVVYGIKCGCGEWYIGETGRDVEIRIKEHKRYCNDKYKNDVDIENKSAVAKHWLTCQQQIDWNNIKIIDVEDVKIRKLKEAYYIKKYKPKLNLSPGVTVPPQWFWFIERYSAFSTLDEAVSVDCT